MLPRPWTIASFWPIAPACARTFSSDTGSLVVKTICAPPVKSIPKLSPRTASETRLIAITAPEIANQSRRRPMKSIWSQRPFCVPAAPMNAGFSNQRKPARRPSIARVAATAVTSETTVPMSSISAKPFTSAVANPNRTSAVMHVTTFASMIVWKPFA